MKTLIYSGYDPHQLNTLRIPYVEGTPVIRRYWPELIPINGGSIPRHPRNILEICPALVGHTIITVSEHVILWFIREVEDKRISYKDLEIYFVGDDGKPKLMRVDEDGVMIDRWPGGFFDERADLLFGPGEEDK